MLTTRETVPASSKGINFENVLASIGAAVLLVSVVLIVDRPSFNERTDFSVTYIGSRMVYMGRGSKLYDLTEQQQLKYQLLPNAPPLIFEHPPFEALLLAPLGGLSYKNAFLIWGLINVAIWLTLPYLLRPYAPTPRDDLAYLMLWLLFAPLGVALFQGQSSLLVLLLYSLTFIQLRSRRDLRAGFIFGLTLFKFQFAFPLLIILLFQRRWRFLQGFLTTTAALAALSMVAVGWGGIVGYVRLLTGIAAHPDNLSYGLAADMATVQGFFYPLVGETLGHATVSLIVAVVSLSLLVWAGWRWKKADPADLRSFDLMFAGAVLVSLVTSLHMFTHDLSPLLLVMFLVLAHFPRKYHRLLRINLSVILVMLWIPPLFFLLLAFHKFYLWFLVLMFLLAGIFRLAEIPGAGLADPTPKSARLSDGVI